MRMYTTLVRRSVLLCLILAWLSGCNSCQKEKPATPDTGKPSPPAPPAVPALGYVYLGFYPHDITAFTEGFLIHEGKLYESTGASEGLPQTRSLFGEVDLGTGKISVKAELDRDKYFGEGITFLDGKVFQLTYTTRVGFIYNARTFKRVGEFPIPSREGWGMTTDGKSLIMSDGTNLLTWLDPRTLKVTKTVAVTENGSERDHLNELEYVNGRLYANIWMTHTIVQIDPETGKVTGTLDLAALANEARSINPGSLEMNGIAYDPANGSFLITGKLWPRIYRIKLNQ